MVDINEWNLSVYVICNEFVRNKYRFEQCYDSCIYTVILTGLHIEIGLQGPIIHTNSRASTLAQNRILIVAANIIRVHSLT